MPYSEVTATLEGFAHAGVTSRHLAALRSNGKPAMEKVAREIRFASGLSLSQAEASNVMGENFFSPESVECRTKIEFSPEHRRMLQEVPFSREMLESVRETHALFPLVPIPVCEIVAQADYIEGDEEDREKEVLQLQACKAFRSSREVRWCLVSKEPVPESRGKTFIEQVRAFPKGHGMARLRELLTLLWLDRSLAKNIGIDGSRCIDCELFAWAERAIIAGDRSPNSRMVLQYFHLFDTADITGVSDNDTSVGAYSSVYPSA